MRSRDKDAKSIATLRFACALAEVIAAFQRVFIVGSIGTNESSSFPESVCGGRRCGGGAGATFALAPLGAMAAAAFKPSALRSSKTPPTRS
eukprot:4325-Pelagococcus_subviridis.AAC.1